MARPGPGPRPAHESRGHAPRKGLQVILRAWPEIAAQPGLAESERAAFVGYLGKRQAGQHTYLVAWSEHSQPHVIYSTTTDFQSFQRDPRGYAKWRGPDGLGSVWRTGNRLYLFAGADVHELLLP